jgi:ABC-type uncharacterized transport system substrate-binding protein
MRRREFIALLAGAAALRPLAAHAQADRVRRVGVLMNLGADDAEGQARLAALLQGLQEAGWVVGRNLRIEIRWGAGDADNFRKHAAELVSHAPDVLFASGIPAATPLLQATGGRPAMSIASSKAKPLPSFRCKRRPNSFSTSTPRPQKRSESLFRKRCLLRPIK